VDCKLLLIAPFLFFLSFFKGRVYIHILGFFNQSYDFSRQISIKHDIDIFINLAKIVRYGRHWDESFNEWQLPLIIYFDSNFPYAKLRPYDDYKNMSTLNTYCGILSTNHTGLTTHSKNRATWLLSLNLRVKWG
jgi:hypothetical protein